MAERLRPKRSDDDDQQEKTKKAERGMTSKWPAATQVPSVSSKVCTEKPWRSSCPRLG